MTRNHFYEPMASNSPGAVVKWFNTPGFQSGIREFDSRQRHPSSDLLLLPERLCS